MALPLLAKSGGALGNYKGREDFKDGKHVAGDGDGQSDDIPAWLADGEFVFPADVVSALGNGSTKAGTDKLYAMMHNIRDRARSKGPKDLPPPALKSPLDYLKSSKRSTA
jgi:flavodoxin